MPTVFLSHSHKDEVWKDRLKTHLGVLKIDAWDDRRIEGGADWFEAIQKAMAHASVAILLISADFLSSRFILGEEVPWLLQRRRSEGVPVIPVIVRSCAWDEVQWLNSIQARPKDGHALASFKGDVLDQELTKIAKEIHSLLNPRVEVVRAPRIALSVEIGDALAVRTDVLALKYAQGLYGVDDAVVERFAAAGISVLARLPEKDKFLLLDTKRMLGAGAVLFIGVDFLNHFRYQEIREFSYLVLAVLRAERPSTRHLTLTLHGAGYGLDEEEAFRSEIGGLAEAIEAGAFPKSLEQITIVEHSLQRAKRLQTVLKDLIPMGSLPARGSLGTGSDEPAAEKLRTAGRDSASKPRVFVAMPFSEDMDDVYEYGIQAPVHAEGFLCERADLSVFTGDIMDWVKQRIAGASIVIGDLTTANPNVYLEVGYAWGCGRPTILVTHETSELKFDVRGQRCLKYRKIKELEQALRRELKRFKELVE